MASGFGKVTWQRVQVMPAWLPESMGKQAPCPENEAGDQRQKPWHPRQASSG